MWGATAQAVCPILPTGPTPPGAWDAHMNEIVNMGELQVVDFQIGDQKIYRMRKREHQGTRDRMLERLQAIAPKIKELQNFFDTPPNRPVLLVESELDVLGTTLAFTQCARRDRLHDLTNYVSEGEDLRVKLPKGLCLVVVRTHTIDDERSKKFALAHEWMHTMQNDAYRQSMRELWWVEGSAEWAAHKIVEGMTGRDHKIEQFFERQKDCALTKHTYDAQPFFFWGDQTFDTSWGISLGMGGRQYLKYPRRAAELLPPERWLDWAIAQAKQTITMPDGRPLPHHPQFESLELTDSCGSYIDGPPLSVQLRELRLPVGAAGPITIKAGNAQVAYQNAAGEWVRVTGTVEVASAASPMLLVAIMPSGDNLNVEVLRSGERDVSCACHIGSWKEQATADSDAQDSMKGALEAMEKVRGMIPPDQLENLEKAKRMIQSADTKDRFRFRSATKQIFEMDGGNVNYQHSGPMVTFRADGKFIIDDPHSIEGEKTRVNYRTYTHSGQWKNENGILKIDIENIYLVGTVEGPNSDGPQEIMDTSRNPSYVGGGGDWVVNCEDFGVKLLPADPKERGAGKDAVLKPY
ncbi:MAG: hypothetical protein HWE27_09115 [Gammaproteobacteria bacterium]|nr:hypothetical protein [Gammaproteobacteria bacterium]